jgi:hypothetical protein
VTETMPRETIDTTAKALAASPVEA